jgi:hypothetical protein
MIKRPGCRLLHLSTGLRANTLKGLSGIVAVSGTVVPWVDLVISGTVVVSIGKIVVLDAVISILFFLEIVFSSLDPMVM